MKTNGIKDVTQMTDRELYAFFRENCFYDDPELTKAVCQELENREAAKTGRIPAMVVFQELVPGARGAATEKDGQKMIILNLEYLRKTVPQILTPAMAMSTIFHEGRHIWQRIVLENEDQRVPLSIRLLLNADQICYTDGCSNVIDVGLLPGLQGRLEYLLQENEMDARFYALRRMMEIQMSTDVDEAFQIRLEEMRQEEIAHIKSALMFFDEEKYQLLEKKRLEKYRTIAETRYRLTGERLPKLPENFRSYQNIWMIHHVVYPVYAFFLHGVEKLRQNVMKANDLLLGLYTAARACALRGKPLEKPEDLMEIVRNREFCMEYDLKQDAIPKEWDKPIGM